MDEPDLDIHAANNPTDLAQAIQMPMTGPAWAAGVLNAYRKMRQAKAAKR